MVVLAKVALLHAFTHVLLEVEVEVYRYVLLGQDVQLVVVI